MIASGNGVGAGVGVGTGVAVWLGVGVGETEGGGLNFGPGQPARKMQKQGGDSVPETFQCSRTQQYTNTPTRLRPELAGVLPDESEPIGTHLCS